jgi:hypothetical protein
VKLQCRVFGDKTGPIAMVQVLVWEDPLPQFGSGSNPHPQPLLILLSVKFLELHWKCDSKLVCISVDAVRLRVTDLMMHQSIGSIRIHSHLGVVFL